MRALEVFGFKHYLSGPSDHQVDFPDGTSESMGLSGISCNIFIWVLLRVGLGNGWALFKFLPDSEAVRRHQPYQNPGDENIAFSAKCNIHIWNWL